MISLALYQYYVNGIPAPIEVLTMGVSFFGTELLALALIKYGKNKHKEEDYT